MAREEHDREDLLRDATAYVDRAEFEVAGLASPVFVGIRHDSAASVYLSPDRVYHFNSSGELRRAFVDVLLYKADRGELVSLARQRNEHETVLVARRLTRDETHAFLSDMRVALIRVADSLVAGAPCRGQVTSDETIARGEAAHDRIANWFSKLPDEFQIAKSARI